MQLSDCISRVLSEFGGALPESLVSYSDVVKELVSVRSLELQKLGIATTNITTSHIEFTPSSREGSLPVPYDYIPSFVEFIPNNTSQDVRIRYKVEILPVESISEYEGARAIAFYGMPRKYLLSWDCWKFGKLDVWFDPVEDFTAINSDTSDITFPPAFWNFLFKKTALNIVRVALLKISMSRDPEIVERMELIRSSLAMFAKDLNNAVAEWEMEMAKFRNLDLNTQPHLRRTQEEILLSSYNNVTGSTPGDYS